MRKILLISALAGALATGGCATLQTIDTAFSLATRSIANPVTATNLYEVESGAQLAFIALNTYKQACIAGSADKNCRANVQAVQTWTRQLPPLLMQLRTFVKQNDQVDALVVYNQLVQLIGAVKNVASNAGIKIGG